MNTLPDNYVPRLGDPRAHRFRRQTRVEVEVIPALHVIAGRALKQGKHTIDVPDDLVPILNAQVVDEGIFARAKQNYGSAVERYKKQHPKDADLAQCPESVSAEYYRAANEGMPPLRSVRVLAENIAPPLSLKEQETAAVFENVAAGMQAQTSADALLARIAELEEKVSRQEAKASKGRSKK